MRNYLGKFLSIQLNVVVRFNVNHNDCSQLIIVEFINCSFQLFVKPIYNSIKTKEGK